MRDLSGIIKAYDVRGVVPDELDSDLARSVGAAFVRVVGAAGDRIVVGHDMRPSSPELVDAFTEGATSQGADVVQIGLYYWKGLYPTTGLYILFLVLSSVGLYEWQREWRGHPQGVARCGHEREGAFDAAWQSGLGMAQGQNDGVDSRVTRPPFPKFRVTRESHPRRVRVLAHQRAAGTRPLQMR